MAPQTSRRTALLGGAALLLGAAAAPDPGLIAQLKRGGLVLVMRHAHSPAQPPAPGAADPANRGGERKLDAAGQAQAEAIGRGLRAAKVPVGAVLSSPTYRAVQTARLMGLGEPTTAAELGDGGQSMAASASGATGAAWLRARAAEPPPVGRDVLVITHQPNIVQAFGAAFGDLQDGEAVVFRRDGRGGVQALGRIRVEDWPSR